MSDPGSDDPPRRQWHDLDVLNNAGNLRKGCEEQVIEHLDAKFGGRELGHKAGLRALD